MSTEKSTTVYNGIGIGTVLAILLSWITNKSIIWCILHAICGWFYVIYWAFVYGM